MNDYIPSSNEQVADQVRRYEASGGVDGGGMNGLRVVIVTHRGHKTGAIRKTPLMRVKDGDNYILVASLGGAENNPLWFYNINAHPEVQLQDGAEVREMRARLVTDPEERDRLWAIATAAFPPYATYQQQTTRQIPLFLLEPR